MLSSGELAQEARTSPCFIHSPSTRNSCKAHRNVGAKSPRGRPEHGYDNVCSAIQASNFLFDVNTLAQDLGSRVETPRGSALQVHRSSHVVDPKGQPRPKSVRCSRRQNASSNTLAYLVHSISLRNTSINSHSRRLFSTNKQNASHRFVRLHQSGRLRLRKRRGWIERQSHNRLPRSGVRMKSNFISVTNLVLTAIINYNKEHRPRHNQCCNARDGTWHLSISFFVKIVTHRAVLACGVKQLLVVPE